MKDAYPYRFYRDGDIAEARAHRNALCELLGIPVPKSVPKAERPPGQAASTARGAAANRDDLGYRGSSMCQQLLANADVLFVAVHGLASKRHTHATHFT